MREELNAQLALWKLAEIVWHLCDIFFLSSKPESVITEPLVTWLQHFDLKVNEVTRSKEELNILIRTIGILQSTLDPLFKEVTVIVCYSL